jgi:hypothetical protein
LRKCCDHAGGGYVLVTQPATDTIATALTGAVVAQAGPVDDAVAGYDFDLSQDFEVVFNDPTVYGAAPSALPVAAVRGQGYHRCGSAYKQTDALAELLGEQRHA